MSALHLPDELVDRLTAEASRRGVSVDELVAETLTDRFPPLGAQPRDALEAFIGCGSSGRREPFDIHQARTEQARSKTAETI